MSGEELVRRMERAMAGGIFEVCGEAIGEHGMEGLWAGYDRTWGWADEGASWPCAVFAPHTEIPRRPYFVGFIEDEGPNGTFDGLDALVRHASGFRAKSNQGRDVSFNRFQLVIWDYRGRIDTLAADGNLVTIEVSPKDDASLKLVGVFSGARTKKPVAITAPSLVTLSLDEPVLHAKVALKCGEDVVAEAEGDFVAEIAMAERRLALPDLETVIFDALERSLRPALRTAPKSERDVQDEVETILRARGVSFHREKERAPVGATSFIPDFTVPELGLAIEVKLAKRGHREPAIQRELAQDATGYRTKWPRVIAVIYDCGGVIRDPDRMRRANEPLGIRVLVVKH